MKIKSALTMLSALAHKTRLDMFRLLVRAGPDGLPAGTIGQRLKLAAPTCSFHLKEMRQAGLLTCERHGRFLIYGVNRDAMTALLGFLTDKCCAETCCTTVSRGAARRPAGGRT